MFDRFRSMALLAALVAGPVQAQGSPADGPPLPGDRIRVAYCQMDCRIAELTATGRVQRLDGVARTLHLHPDVRLRVRLSVNGARFYRYPLTVRDTTYEIRTPQGLRAFPLGPGWDHGVERLSIPLERAIRVEVRSTRSRGRGAARGALLASAVGGVGMGALAVIDLGDTFFTPMGAFVIGGVVGAVLAAPVGAVVGAVRPGSRWEEAPCLLDSCR